MTFDRGVDIAYMDRLRHRQITVIDGLVARGARQERERLRREVARLRLAVIRGQVNWNDDEIWLNWIDATLREPK